MSDRLPVNNVISVCTFLGEEELNLFRSAGILQHAKETQKPMSSLSEVVGDRLVNLRHGWKIREPGRYGYIALEEDAGSSFFVFYLLVGGSWKRLSFRKFDGDASIYLAASSGVVVDVAMEDGNPRPILQLLVEIEGESRWWLIYWWTAVTRVLLASVRTSVDPYTVIV